MAPRIVQNFAGYRAVVVTASCAGIETLQATLTKLGLTVEKPSIIDGKAELDVNLLQRNRDVLFVDGDLESPIVLDMRSGLLPDYPVVGIVGVEAPSRLKALSNLGATSFIRKPIYGGAVYTSLFLGINQFLHRKDMEEQLDELRDRRRRRSVVIKAILMVMQQDGLSDEQAYRKLRDESMRSRQVLEDFCESYLARSAALVASQPELHVSADHALRRPGQTH